MAEVKRYTASIMHPGVREDPEGLLVAYRHYEELKTEVERLTKELENTDCMFAMASAFARDWNAAKEGKQP
jgi:5'-deoxynucleotidase YfbR-like HD superfamily hydrolase